MEGRDLSLRTPQTGVRIWAHAWLPPGAGPARPVPAAIVVPGGLGAGSETKVSRLPASLVEAGLAVVLFDPDGRGRSGGEEDWGGHVHQETLHRLMTHVASLPYVRTDNIGVLSLSLGIATAAGALGRCRDDPPVRYLIDLEGPTDRFYITVHDHPNFLPLFDGHTSDQADWWAPREAVRSIPRARVRYLRLQSAEDHVHGQDIGHAVDIVNAATHARFGGGGACPWTRVNLPDDNPANRTYTRPSPPVCPELPFNGGLMPWLVAAVAEMAFGPDT